MKNTFSKMYWLSWTVTLAGFVFKFLHYPFAGILLVAGGTLLLIHSFAFLSKNYHQLKERSLLYLTIALLTVYLETRFLFWGVGRLIFYLTLLSMAMWIISVVRKKFEFDFSKLILLIYFIFISWVSFIPSYKIYYLVHLGPLLNSEANETNYEAWDRYSWFLYLRDQYDSSFEANQKAQQAFRKYQEIVHDDTKQYENILMQHEFQIVHKEWENYP